MYYIAVRIVSCECYKDSQQVENIVYFCFLQTSMMTKYLDAHFLVLPFGPFLGSDGYWVVACSL